MFNGALVPEKRFITGLFVLRIGWWKWTGSQEQQGHFDGYLGME